MRQKHMMVLIQPAVSSKLGSIQVLTASGRAQMPVTSISMHATPLKKPTRLSGWNRKSSAMPRSSRLPRAMRWGSSSPDSEMPSTRPNTERVSRSMPRTKGVRPIMARRGRRSRRMRRAMSLLSRRTAKAVAVPMVKRTPSATGAALSWVLLFLAISPSPLLYI